MEDADYQQYEEYSQSGVLDEEGYYTGTDDSDSEKGEEDSAAGTIHVTFAENRSLRISYYTDEDCSDQINTDACYLNPGDAIYASDTVSVNENSNLYRLSEYRIFAYDSAGERSLLGVQEDLTSNLIYHIPDDYAGTELSIFPVGEYPARQLSMDVYYTNDEGEKTELSGAGMWYINDSECLGDTAEISAVESYIVMFDYDEENYFYVDASPTPFTQDPNSTGFVEFWEADPTEAEVSYEVEVHPYLSLTVKLDEAGTVTVNGDSAQLISGGKSWTSGKIAYGDEIVIETEGECTITSGDYHHFRAVRESLYHGFRYTLTVEPEYEENAATVLQQSINVNRVTAVTLEAEGDYGTCTYELDGETVEGTVEIQEGQTLTATYTITDDGYCFDESENSSGILGSIHDLFQSNERTVTIQVPTESDEVTIDPDDWFAIREKGD
ncbi:MAG: hypothetical protein LUC27_05095 [Lachnospiraceae bacterium]|nr:hypothetical protein [Lachnospiraceae bacterium]